MKCRTRHTGRIGLAIALAALAGATLVAMASIEEVHIGATEQEVYRVMGKPHGTMRADGGTILLYEKAGVEIHDGRVFRIDPSLGVTTMKSRNPDGKATEGGWLDTLYGWSDSVREKTYALFGKDVPESKPEPEVEPAKPVTASYSAVKTVSNEGKPVALPRLLVPDSVTIVDFYADWCGPCRRVSPKLELLAQQDQQVYLRKVDIVRWGTEVAQQHNVTSVPHIRVYNRNGDLVGSPTSDFKQVVEYVNLAK